MVEIAQETEIQRYKTRATQLWDDAAPYRAHWKEIVEYELPRHGKYLTMKQDDPKDAGSRKDQKVINGSGQDSLRIVAAGLQGGLTSPARPWFVLTIRDKDLREYGPVKTWLSDVRDILLMILARSNFYGAMHGLYKELAAFGTACMLIEEDLTSGLRCRPFTIGEFMLDLDSTYRPNALFRQFSMSARQMVEKFGEKNVTESVRAALKGNSGGQRYEIQHVICPNKDVDASKADQRGMKFKSDYYEINGDGEKFLKRGGYRGKSFVAMRWEVKGVNAYGDCPGMEALGDIKMLQKMEEKKLKALDKMVDPPMNAPLSMKQKGGTVIAGGVNYLDVQQGQQGFTPAYQVNPDLQNIAFEIDRVEKRIKKFFYNDLFLMVAQDAGRAQTAYEIAKKYEEKMMLLGPVLESVQESQDDVIDRAYFIAEQLGILPPPPQELIGQDIKVEYIGVFAQAQKMIANAPISETATFVGQLALVKPEVTDKFDFDQAVDEFSMGNGTPPRCIVPDDEVAGKRADRAKQQQQMQAASQMAAAADTAKKASETKLGEGSLLDKMGAQMGMGQ
jgi:hypothetical protein